MNAVWWRDSLEASTIFFVFAVVCYVVLVIVGERDDVASLGGVSVIMTVLGESGRHLCGLKCLRQNFKDLAENEDFGLKTVSFTGK